MNGTDLKLQRIAAHVKAKDLADAIGWSPWRISRIENRVHVEPVDAQAYVAGLATITTDTTPSQDGRTAA